MYTPLLLPPESEKSESDVTSLDPDEEGCVLVAEHDGKDMNFRCHREHKSDYRQNKIDDYLSYHCLNAIPIGVKTLDVEVLTNIHLYLYHRLPSPEALKVLKHNKDRKPVDKAEKKDKSAKRKQEREAPQ